MALPENPDKTQQQTRITWSPSTTSNPQFDKINQDNQVNQVAEKGAQKRPLPPQYPPSSSIDWRKVWSRSASTRAGILRKRRALPGGSTSRRSSATSDSSDSRVNTAPRGNQPAARVIISYPLELTEVESSSGSSSLAETRAAAWVFPELLGPPSPISEHHMMDTLGPIRASSDVDRYKQEDEGDDTDPRKLSGLSDYAEVITKQPGVFQPPVQERREEDEVTKFVNCACVTVCCPLFVLCPPVLCPREYERVVIFRLGQLTSGAPIGPGASFYNPFLDTVVKVDMRIVTTDINPQEVLTRDGVLIQVDAVVHFKVDDAVSSCCDVADYRAATLLMCEGTMRSVLGKYTLSDILERKASITEDFEQTLSESTSKWGVSVASLALKNFQLPQDMIRTMSKEAESQKLAKAKVERAKGEERAAIHLAEASRCFHSPTAVSLRSLEELIKIASKKPSLTLFPLPLPSWNW